MPFFLRLRENEIVSMMSTTQKQSFIIFKRIVTYSLSDDSVLSTYCLKTVLFWTMEKLPKKKWDDDIHGLGFGVIFLMDTIIHFLVDCNIPQYFIPENNLIHGKNPHKVKATLRKLIGLRRDPVEKLLAFDDQYALLTWGVDAIRSFLTNTTEEYRLSAKS